jgi:hypothetical protein
MIGSLALSGQAAIAVQGGYSMHIALHDGFTGQTVTIAVDGQQVYRRTGVRTDLRISRADALDVEVSHAGQIRIEVTIEPGNQQASTVVDPSATPNLAVDLTAGSIHFKASAEPFHYM